jgi:hypothetical protein
LSIKGTLFISSKTKKGTECYSEQTSQGQDVQIRNAFKINEQKETRCMPTTHTLEELFFLLREEKIDDLTLHNTSKK